MKKHLLLLFSLVLATTMVFADRVSQEDAALVANNFLNGAVSTTKAGVKAATPNRMTLKKAASTATNESLYYVYENPNGGWVMVSASDAAHPILGYSKTGTFNTDNQPDNVKYWLTRYERQLRKAEDHNVAASEDIQTEWNALRNGDVRKGTVVPVKPLLTSQWNQNAPYNNLCPIDPADNTKSATGCVATATAQIMYYHKWPEKGQGSRTYNWTSDAGGSGTSSADFGATTYDWTNMKDKHTTSDSQAQKTAIATLMFHVGVACKMQYGGDASGGSGAYTKDMVAGLKAFFRYKNTATIHSVDDEGVSTAANNIIAEVRANRPVLMGGATTQGEGHEFVCDGVDENGYLSINWGWGGLSDGYFALAALDPDKQGAGGASSGEGFSQGVEYVTGIEPEKNPVNVAGVTVAPTSGTIKIKERFQLTTTISPSNASNKAVVWLTSDASVATVTETGVVVGVAQGTATITAKTNDGNKTASCTITVTNEIAPATVLNVDAGQAWYESQYEDPWTIAVYNSKTSGNIPTVYFYPVNSSTNKIAGTYTLSNGSGLIFNDPNDTDSYVFITSGQLVISCTGNGNNGCKKYRVASVFTCEDGAEYQVDLTTQICATDDDDNSISLADNVGDGAFYEMTWQVQGQTFATTYAVDGKLVLPLDKPADCASGKVFVGWTSASSVSGDEPPAFAKDGSAVTASATYHAVYATAGSAGGSSTVTFTAGTDVSETKSIEKGGVTISFSDGVFNRTDNYRCYKGETMTVSASADISKIVLTCPSSNPASNFTGDGYSDGVWEGSSSSVELTASVAQVRITKIEVTVGGGVSYSDYSFECGAAPAEPITIRFKNTANWSNVYLWAWHGETNIFDAWPGQKLTKDEDGLYTYTFDDSVTEVNVIFNNNDGSQTADLASNITESACLIFDGNSNPAKIVDCSEMIPDLYILGQVPGNDYVWNPTKGTKMNYSKGKYTLTTRVAEAADLVKPGTINFTTKLAATADDDGWNSIAGYRWAAEKNEKEVKDGKTYYIWQEVVDNSFKFDAGTWMIEVDLYEQRMAVTLVEQEIAYTVNWSVAGVVKESKTYASGAALTMPEITVPDCEGDGAKVFVGWTAETTVDGDAPADLFTKAGGKTVTADVTYNAVFAKATTSSGGGTSTVTDELDAALTGITTNNQYSEWSGKTSNSDAVYAGQSAKNSADAIQMRSNNSNSGIVTTESGGKAKKVTITWNDATSGKTLQVYGSNTAYTAATDLYGNNKGTLVGTIASDTQTELEIDGDYAYIGLRSASGAIYIDKIEIDWETTGGGSSTSYSEYVLSCDGSTSKSYTFTLVDVPDTWETPLYLFAWLDVSIVGDWPGIQMTKNAKALDAPYSATVTVENSDDVPSIIFSSANNLQTVDITDAVPGARYRVNAATDASGKYSANVVYKVTAAAENGSVSGLGDWYAEGENVSFSITAAEGYELDQLTVKDADNQSVEVNNNEFVMPAKDVTITASFKAKEVTYTVKWSVAGETKESKTYASGAELAMPEIAAPACEGEGAKVFVGWTEETTVDGSAPADLFTKAGGKTVTANVTYNAVFAKATTSSGGGSAAAVGTTLWGEDFSGFGAKDVPSASNSSTIVYGDGSLTYSVENGEGTTMVYTGTMSAGGTEPEILIAKKDGALSADGVPTGGATEMSLVFLSNRTTFSVTTTNDNLTISGSGKEWTISVAEGKSSPETFDLTITNTGSSNSRVDEIVLSVVTAGAGGGSSTTYSEYALTCDGSAISTTKYVIAGGLTELGDWDLTKAPELTVDGNIATLTIEDVPINDVTMAEGDIVTDPVKYYLIRYKAVIIEGENQTWIGDPDEGDADGNYVLKIYDAGIYKLTFTLKLDEQKVYIGVERTDFTDYVFKVVQKPSNWDANVNIFAWGTSAGTVIVNNEDTSVWPGVTMGKDDDGYYSADLRIYGDGNTPNLIFTDGANQTVNLISQSASARYRINETKEDGKNTADIVYKATLGDATNGALTFNTWNAENENVTVAVTPDEGYALTKLIVKDDKEEPVEVDGNTFVMPAKDVTVSAVFSQLHTIKWVVLGVETAQQVADGAALVLPAVADCANGTKFVGWTAESSLSGDRPADLFATATGKIVTADATYYAVYAAVADVADALTNDIVGAAENTYANWSGITVVSDAVYAGNSAGTYNSIQLRSSGNTAGVVTTASGGKARRIAVDWNSNTADGRTLNVYGSNSAYESASNLYDESLRGTSLGTIKKGSSNELFINGDYEYIGIRSASSALYLDKLEITWDVADDANEYALDCGAVIVKHTVTWSACGDEYDSQEYEDGELLVFPTAPGKNSAGKEFVGWIAEEHYSDTTSPTFIEEGSQVKASVTYYAVYK